MVLLSANALCWAGHVFNHLEDASGWLSCGASCAGGETNGVFWMAQNQTSPSLDGSSMEMYSSSIGEYSNSLFYLRFNQGNKYDYAQNFIWDFYVNMDSASVQSGEALEFDQFQFVNSWSYMMGTECSYGSGKWDVWDNYKLAWVHTNIPCAKFTPNTWHHIQLHATANHAAHEYTFQSIVIDGHAYHPQMTFKAKYMPDWVGGENLGVQHQLDVKPQSAGYHVWIDKSTFTIW
jgi:hypothetical protein